MVKKLYVGGVSYEETDDSLRALFTPHGVVNSAMIIMDRDTGRSKGFGFVEMASDKEAENAIRAVNGQTVNGRSLTVNEAKPKESRGSGSGNERGGYGGGRRY